MSKEFRTQVEELAKTDTSINLRGMGDTQWSVLQSFAARGGWSPGSGWHWDGAATTARYGDSFVKRGLATKVESDRPHGYASYTITPAVVEIDRVIERARDAANNERWRAKAQQEEAERRVAEARKQAINALIAAHADEFRALVQAELDRAVSA